VSREKPRQGGGGVAKEGQLIEEPRKIFPTRYTDGPPVIVHPFLRSTPDITHGDPALCHPEALV